LTARVVLDSGIPVTFVPLDVTELVCLEMGQVVGEIEPLGTRLSRFTADVTRGYIRYHMETEGKPGCYLHDPLAVAYAVDPTLCGARDAFVQIETAGSVSLGMTVADFRHPKPPNARVCLEVDTPRFLRMFLDRLKPPGH